MSNIVRFMNNDWEHTGMFTPVATSKSGSKLRRDWSVIPWNGMSQVLEAFEEGRKYDQGEVKGWTLDEHQDSLLHLVEHAIAAMNTTGEYQREHLTHVAARALMALEQIYREANENGY